MSSKVALELFYFPIAGRAGPIRDAAKFGGIEFKDTHVQFAEWANFKPTTPYGSVPVLSVTINGETRQYAQSNSILRYFGKLSGLYPADALEALAVDQTMDFVEDLASLVSGKETDPQRKKEYRERIARDVLPGMLERAMKDVKGKFVLGDTFSIADLKLASLFGWFLSGAVDHISKDIVKPDMLAYAARVEEAKARK